MVQVTTPKNLQSKDDAAENLQEEVLFQKKEGEEKKQSKAKYNYKKRDPSLFNFFFFLNRQAKQ
jgi:hypothetical protein